MWLLIASAALALIFVASAGAYAFVHGRRVFRQLGAFGPALDAVLEPVSAGAERLGANPSRADLALRLEYLRVSNARLAVLLAAVADVRAAVGRVTGVVPRK
jgi:hypothetical protein